MNDHATCYQCSVCRRTYNPPAAMRRGFRCHGHLLQRVAAAHRLDAQPLLLAVQGGVPGAAAAGGGPVEPDGSTGPPQGAGDGYPPDGSTSSLHEPVAGLIVIPSRDNQVDALALEGLLASLTASTFALEIAGDEAGRRFAVRARPPTLRYLRAQLESVYGQVSFRPLDAGADPVAGPVDAGLEVAAGRMRLERLPALGLRTFRDGDFKQADPVRGVLGAFSGFAPGERALAQLVLRPAPRGWDSTFGKPITSTRISIITGITRMLPVRSIRKNTKLKHSSIRPQTLSRSTRTRKNPSCWWSRRTRPTRRFRPNFCRQAIWTRFHPPRNFIARPTCPRPAVHAPWRSCAAIWRWR